jgi:hypothetical protein
MEMRSVNYKGLYVKVYQCGELPLNKLLNKQNLLFYAFHVCALISCILNKSTNVHECWNVI